MKRLSPALTTVFIILTALVLSATGQRKNEVSALPFSAAAYTVGERLTYNVSLSSFVSAAHVEILVAARGTFFDKDAFQLKAHVETKGVVYAALYALNNDYTTYVDAASGVPFRTEKTATDGGRPITATNEINVAGTGPETTVYDVLSAVYRLRAVPLAEGSDYPISVLSDSTGYQAELQVKGHETVRTNVGSFNTIVAQLRVNKSVVNDYRVQVYLTDDERHVPVLVTAKLAAGQLRAELASSQIVNGGPKPQTAGPTPTPTPSPTPAPTPRRQPTPTPKPVQRTDLPGLPFTIGEQLNYRIYLGGGPTAVGLVTYQVRSRSRYFDHDGVMLTTSAQTTDAAQRIFVVNDQLTSYVDPLTFLPYRFEQTLAEGKRHRAEIWSINQDYGNATKQGAPKIDIPIGTHDYLSIFYAVRSMNLAPSKQNAVSMLVNGRPRTMIITAVQRDTIQLDSQKIPAIQIKLTTPEDPQPDKFQFRAWISADDRRLPLRLTAVTDLGALRADLVILSVTPQ